MCFTITSKILVRKQVEVTNKYDMELFLYFYNTIPHYYSCIEFKVYQVCIKQMLIVTCISVIPPTGTTPWRGFIIIPSIGVVFKI